MTSFEHTVVNGIGEVRQLRDILSTFDTMHLAVGFGDFLWPYHYQPLPVLRASVTNEGYFVYITTNPDGSLTMDYKKAIRWAQESDGDRLGIGLSMVDGVCIWVENSMEPEAIDQIRKQASAQELAKVNSDFQRIIDNPPVGLKEGLATAKEGTLVRQYNVSLQFHSTSNPEPDCYLVEDMDGNGSMFWNPEAGFWKAKFDQRYPLAKGLVSYLVEEQANASPWNRTEFYVTRARSPEIAAERAREVIIEDMASVLGTTY